MGLLDVLNREIPDQGIPKTAEITKYKENLILTVKGQTYSGWESIDISRSINTISSTYILKTTNIHLRNHFPWNYNL